MTAAVPGLRVGAPLGSGAGGTVHEAVVEVASPGLEVGDVVAVKLVQAESVDLWQREAAVASGLRHPGIVRVLASGQVEATDEDVEDGAGTWGETGWIVMDRLDGPDLATVLADGPIEPEEAVDLVLAVLEAMAVVHDAGVVHRDLKPANVVMHEGRPVVVDFGIARVSEGSADHTGGGDWARTAPTASTGVGAAVGTFAWMAPEQWRGEPVSPATDVYALGGLLHALLTGRAPYSAATLPELAYDIALSDVPVPSDLGATSRYDPAVHAALMKDPAERPHDASALAELVRACRAGTASAVPRSLTPSRGAGAADVAPTEHAAQPSSTAPPPSSTPRRRTALVAAAAVVLVGLAAGIGLLVGEGRGAAGADGPVEGDVLTVCAEREATMRTAPRSEKVVRKLPHGMQVTVVDDVRNTPTWTHVRAGDDEGFVLLEFVHARC